jgi:hypothetical protein
VVGVEGVAGWRTRGLRAPHRTTATMPPQEQVFSGTQIAYLESMEEQWKDDPTSVHAVRVPN